MPRDPDEVAPVAPITRKQSTTPIAPPSTEPPVAHQNHADTVHRHLRATAAEFVPRSANARPTQVHNVQLALQQPASYLAHALTRIPQNVIGTGRPLRRTSPEAAQLDRPINNEQHPLVRTNRQQPRVRPSQTRDRHVQAEEPTTVRRLASAAIIERVRAWRDQVIPEQSSQSTYYASHRLPTNHSGSFTFPPDPRNDSHDYYPDSRLED
ncbi:hypothetical protein EDB85DRAFT_1885233 [Lactarius pseudohatsudake]|nr:hypothetical protein EDB85DRAFT_1885233 [Lactarius pseudohatsudake]